jgi:LysR family nitrogen assimilation transcriptional regulator
MDARQLEYFIRIATCGGFNRAAVELRIAQSALSRRVRLLEEELGVPLLVRGRRGAALTSAGELLFERAEGILRQLREVKDEVASEANVPRGELAIGMPPSLQDMITVPLLAELRARFPTVLIRTWIATSMALRDMVLSGDLDLAVFGIIEPEARLDLTPLLRDAMFLVGAPGAAVETRKPVDWTDIALQPMILTSRPNSVRLLVEAAAAKHRRRLNVVMEVNYIPVLIDLVRRGVGVSMLPYSAVRAYVDRGELSAAKIAGLDYAWAIATARGKPVSAAARSARDLLAELARRRVVDEKWPHARLAQKPGRPMREKGVAKK